MNKVIKIVGGIIVGLILFIIVIAIISNPSSVQEGIEDGLSHNSPEPTSLNVLEAEQQRAEDNPAYALASLNTGVPNPSPQDVQTFQALLNSLDQKCTENDQQTIADQIVRAKDLLQERADVEMSYLEVAQNINSSIPQESNNSISCAEASAAFLTLTISQ